MQESISVVIPVHNRPQDVNTALDSVMAQTLLPLEVIVVDDCSTDDTVAALHSRKGDPVSVRVELVTPNRGGGHARNVGINAARGEWIALLDSDDRWTPDKLALQSARLGGATAADSDVVCFSNLAVDHRDGSPLKPWNELPYAEGADIATFMLADHQAIQTSTLLMPTRLARKVHFDKRLRRHQDLDFVLRLYQHGARFLYIDAALVIYSADPAAARVSKRKNAAPSLTWLELAQAYTPRPLLSRFYTREVFGMDYEDHPMQALARLAGHVARGGVDPLTALQTALREIVPARAKQFAKAMMGR